MSNIKFIKMKPFVSRPFYETKLNVEGCATMLFKSGCVNSKLCKKITVCDMKDMKTKSLKVL